MSIVEFRGGPVTHRSLMNKSKDRLASDYLEVLRVVDRLRERAALLNVLEDLYDSEINCGLSSFWDSGFNVWIGDEANGYAARANVDPHDRDPAWLRNAAAWLRDQACALYPDSEFARRVKAEAEHG